jgi:magnesium chelatase subunit H
VEAALDGADVFFGSLLFDYDQVEWLREKVAKIPIRLVFESALELMGQTQIGTFQMAPDGKAAGLKATNPLIHSLFSCDQK